MCSMTRSTSFSAKEELKVSITGSPPLKLASPRLGGLQLLDCQPCFELFVATSWADLAQIMPFRF